jgi:hypothetical protein
MYFDVVKGYPDQSESSIRRKFLNAEGSCDYRSRADIWSQSINGIAIQFNLLM